MLIITQAWKTFLQPDSGMHHFKELLAIEFRKAVYERRDSFGKAFLELWKAKQKRILGAQIEKEFGGKIRLQWKANLEIYYKIM